MAKVTKKINIRVEVYPEIYLKALSSEKQELIDANHIVAQIERHVDDVADIHVVYETEIICEYCGWDWEINEDPDDPDFGLGEPFCCAKAQKEWREEK